MCELDEIRQEQKNLLLSLQQLNQAMQLLKTMQNEHAKQLQQNRNALEKLAALQDLEFIEALTDWVSKKKWTELKKNPRD